MAPLLRLALEDLRRHKTHTLLPVLGVARDLEWQIDSVLSTSGEYGLRLFPLVHMRNVRNRTFVPVGVHQYRLALHRTSRTFCKVNSLALRPSVASLVPVT